MTNLPLTPPAQPVCAIGTYFLDMPCKIMFMIEHTFCPEIHNAHTCRLWATGVSSSLATRATLTWVSRGRMGQSIIWGGSTSDLIFVPLHNCI
jgi:hypothetical protein